MRPRLIPTPALLLLAFAGQPLAAQLPLLTAPRGTLRLDFGGSFSPTTSEWANGSKRDLGAPLTLGTVTAAATPLLGDLESRLGEILARPATATGLGGLTTVAEHQRGIATLGLALGITRRITIFGTVPIVSVRTQRTLAYDATGATVGLNPADPVIGSPAGRSQTLLFFNQFDAAISTLATRVTRGDYANNPTKLALAQQTLMTAPSLRGSLYTLLADSLVASAVLPTMQSGDGAALLGRITGVQSVFNNDLGIVGFNGAPALPTSVIDANGFDALLASPTGFGIAAPEDLPLVGLGDMEIGATAQLLGAGRPGDARWLGVWVQGLGRLRTGKLPRPAYLFDQGTGDRQPDVEVAGIVEFGRGRLGLRGEARYTMQLPSNRFALVANRDQVLIPTYRSAPVRRNPGDILAVTAQPFFRLAPHLAVAGLVTYRKRGSDATSYLGEQTPVDETLATVLDAGTASDALVIGGGLSYVHDGLHRDGILRMPVEAGLSIERTIRSGSGVVPAPLTSRLVFRVYKALIRH